MQVDFPVFVLSKDSGDVEQFASIADLQKALERIDVENGEYEAWDKNGVPLDLRVQEPVWLDIRRAAEPGGRRTLHAALRDFAISIGAELTNAADDTPSRTFARIATKRRGDQRK